MEVKSFKCSEKKEILRAVFSCPLDNLICWGSSSHLFESCWELLFLMSRRNFPSQFVVIASCVELKKHLFCAPIWLLLLCPPRVIQLWAGQQVECWVRIREPPELQTNLSHWPGDARNHWPAADRWPARLSHPLHISMLDGPGWVRLYFCGCVWKGFVSCTENVRSLLKP